MNAKTNSKKKPQHWYKSPWLIGWLMLVITVLVVNAYMIMQSINDFPGLVVDDFYERGQDYEENINQKLKNNNQWLSHFSIVEIHENQQTIIGFSITDHEKQPAVVEKITLFAYRPSDADKDFSVSMKNNIENPNLYQAALSFPVKGKWDLIASAVINGIEVNYAHRIFVKD